ncbi:MAG: UDP-2,3-diacylglucosamine diphosphatase [Pseudomonadota bacterium]
MFTKPSSLNFRTVFISDLHLGTKRSQTEMVLEFLKHVEADTIYLVGDIVDNWALRRKWFWAQSHNDVIQKLLRKARKGTEIIYIPGNHDEQFRDFVDQAFGNVRVEMQAMHVTSTGQKYLVLHGDEFDGVVLYHKWLAHLGDHAYELAVSLNYYFNRVRRFFRLPYWSLSAYLKRRVKRAVEFIGNFEAVVVREAKARGAHGVICGHIHSAEMRMIGDIHYCNDGDWVESCTALVETHEGEMMLLDWGALRETLKEKTDAAPDRDRRLVPAG